MTKLGQGGAQDMPGRGKGASGHPVLWHQTPAVDFVPFADGGGYPVQFLEWAYRTLGVTDPSRVVHLCSGSLRVGIRVDIRPEMEPTVVADCRATGLPGAAYDWDMADPPYSPEYAANLYGLPPSAYPAPSEILREAARLLRPGGRVGLLHFQVPLRGSDTPLVFERVWGVTQGAGYAIRAWSVYRKPDEGLGL